MTESEICELLSQDPEIVRILSAVRRLGWDSWAVAAGTIRSRVWDHLHGYTDITQPGDVDVIYFDKHSQVGEEEYEAKLRELEPEFNWEVVNQAHIHSYNREEPYQSLEHAMSRWAETATMIGAYLTEDGQVRLIAPQGLDDLVNMVVRPNLLTPDSREVYLERVSNKGWKQRWPKITILMPE